MSWRIDSVRHAIFWLVCIVSSSACGTLNKKKTKVADVVAADKERTSADNLPQPSTTPTPTTNPVAAGPIPPAIAPTASPTPTSTPVVDNTVKVTSLAAGEYFNCARLADGAVKCWGLLSYQLADKRLVPTTITGLGAGRSATAIT